MADGLKLRLPATSANLGPGFDALGLAMDFALEIEARESDLFSITSTGRNVAQTGDVDDSLVLETYRSVLDGQGIDPVPLHLDLHNEIPLGMGCGSSAAALVAGVMLASHFGNLGWSKHKVLTEASLREGHPDNVAACVLGGLTVSLMTAEGEVDALSIHPPVDWPLLVVMPDSSLSTKKARAMLPESYSKADTIANVQRVAMLTAAFAQGRGDLLSRAMEDRMHQPYRAPVCPLLPFLLPLAGSRGVLGVALSGAGPSVLLILESGHQEAAKDAVGMILRESGINAEVIVTTIFAV
ncbi:homoserine kinase [Terriglobus sp. RCC_193]|uniref:homoserine kinase n=1 Tax=Terriglobus sp. RCC_193 TaxID=3239218 RepID=UPI003523F87A